MKWFYIFVRQDIPLEQQIIQTNHATQQMSAKYRRTGIPNIVLIGVPGETELRNVITHLTEHNIKFVAFEDNDFDFKQAAVVTVPLDIKQKQFLRGYPLLRAK